MPGADVFRLNFSHGSHAEHRARYDADPRASSARAGRPIGVLADLQGPKLRVGPLAEGPITLTQGDASASTSTRPRATATRVPLPHPEVLAALAPGRAAAARRRQAPARGGGAGADTAVTA